MNPEMMFEIGITLGRLLGAPVAKPDGNSPIWISSSLPVHPAAAWYTTRHDPPDNLKFMDYVRALDRLPQTSISELRDAESDAFLLSILICRQAQYDNLRRRFLHSTK